MQDTSFGYKFSTFTVGAILKQSIIERDDKLRSIFQLRGIDGIKTAITKQLGKKFVMKTKKHIDHLSPDTTFTINFKTEQCNVKTNPFFCMEDILKIREVYLKRKSHVEIAKVKVVFFAIIMG
tara:strand:+ start:175 stop:543 length:369 start_codon:yes stop_codon:yes gene_type:complete